MISCPLNANVRGQWPGEMNRSSAPSLNVQLFERFKKRSDRVSDRIELLVSPEVTRSDRQIQERGNTSTDSDGSRAGIPCSVRLTITMGYGGQKFRSEIRRGIPGVTSRLSRRLPRLRPPRRADLRWKSEKPETPPFAIPQHSAAKKASPHARDRERSRALRNPVCAEPSRRVPHGGDTDSKTSATLEHRGRVLVSLPADRNPSRKRQHRVLYDDDSGGRSQRVPRL